MRQASAIPPTQPGAGEDTRPRQERIEAMSELLWCVHTIGPDDVNAAPDFDTAEQWAIRQNQMMRDYTRDTGMTNDPHWPEVRSVVALRPWDADTHAADLPNSIAMFTPPAGRGRPYSPNSGRSS